MAAERILVVDDDAASRDVLRRILVRGGYEVVDTFSAEEALALLHREQFELVTLDVMMPFVDGFECCRRIREFSNVPVIFVTARAEVDSEVTGLDVGGDDYILKPYRTEAVVMRVKAVLRRSRESQAEPLAQVTDIGPIRLDHRLQEAYVDGAALGLTAKEFGLLHLLMQHCGAIVPRQRLARHVWGDDFDSESRTLDVHVYRLRRKLDSVGGLGQHLVTKRQRGYLLSGALCEVG